ncbi:LexA family protein [Saezia sanguinis]|uniref:LexA family protein n=1 Tax=Saezia sanguinis TaxID=1965230 RepID=UPI00305653FD
MSSKKDNPTSIDPASLTLPMAESSVQAGFPSPADDFHVKRIDLTEELIKHPQATFLLRVSGDSMRDAGIDDGDTLIVDRAIKPAHGQIVVAVIDGDFTVKYLYKKPGKVRLRPANPTYPEITFKEGQTVEIWGVVTSCIKRFQV